MAAGETTITIVGNLTADPELRFTPAGVAMVKFTVASTPRVFDRSKDEYRDGEPLFMACTAWRDPAEHIAESLAKGMRVLVSGRLRLSRWLVFLTSFGPTAWSWLVADRHLLRSCFARLVRATTGGGRPGSLPLVLWAKPTPAGERVWLWLRPGLELADLDGKTGRMAVACGAKQIRVVAASERYAALIRVDVARRDPLSGRIDSPLALLIPGLKTKREKTDEQVLVPLVGLDLADIPEPVDPEPRGGRR